MKKLLGLTLVAVLATAAVSAFADDVANKAKAEETCKAKYTATTKEYTDCVTAELAKLNPTTTTAPTAAATTPAKK